MPKLEEIVQAAGIAAPLTTLFEIPGEKAYRLTVASGEAIATWKKLRDLVQQTRHWPVLLGEGPHLETLLESVPEFADEPPAKIIGEGLKLNVSEWLEDRHEERVEDEDEDDEDEDDEDEDEEDEDEDDAKDVDPRFKDIPRGPWPGNVPPRTDYYIPGNLGHDGKICIGLVPTMQSWHVPAYLRFGGWEDCPFAEEHVALIRYWQGRFGAEVVGIAGDVVEMFVPRPPQDQRSALELAREHWIYCEEIVAQGTQTLENLAANLLKAPVWCFWWD